MKNYIRWIRNLVGHEKIFLNFAIAIIVNEKGEILFQRRGDVNMWGLPGGALELGESAEEALLREIKEETGLEIRIERPLGVYTKYFSEYPNGDRAQTIGFIFVCRSSGGLLKGDGTESLELKYFSPEEIPALYFKQHEDAINDYRTGKSGIFR